jgi:hypothetical protein
MQGAQLIFVSPLDLLEEQTTSSDMAGMYCKYMCLYTCVDIKEGNSLQ